MKKIFLLLILCVSYNSYCEGKKVQRIVSLSPAATEQIFILGAEDRLLACTNYCVRPESAKNKEKIGTILDINLEKVVFLNPDLVIGSSLTKPGTVAKLKELGINVLIFKSPNDFKTFFKQFVELAELIGEREKAKEISQKSLGSLEKISYIVSALDKKPKVLFQIGAKPLFAAGSDSFVSDFIIYAGGKNIIGNKKSGVYSKEIVLEYNPDTILIAAMGLVGESEKNEWLKFSSLNAAKNEKIFVLDSTSVCSPSPTELPKTVSEIACLFFPEHKDKIKSCIKE